MKSIIKLILLIIIDSVSGKLILMFPYELRAAAFMAFMGLICFNGYVIFYGEGE
ncbi:MAG: hypothetical protein GY714_18225 [Desulfobacterales bacterium]|nr:hypothetical protein [Desulfobacterales bacterium]